MIATTVRSRSVAAHERIDAQFFTSTGMAAEERISVLDAEGVEVVELGDLCRPWTPLRFKRNYAGRDEANVGYLRPYDVFEFLPSPSDYLSVRHNRSLESLVVQKGQILQTCSGRNLGPGAYVDQTLDGLALSHDMVRIEIEDPEIRHFVFAYLRTPTAQALLRRGRSGSVIDHLTVADVSRLAVPMVSQDVRHEVAAEVGDALHLIERARLEIARHQSEYESTLPVVNHQVSKEGWTVRSSSLVDRIDVAFHAPALSDLRNSLRSGGASLCGSVATAQVPARYKRYYVDRSNGRPILSGRQILQIEPINLRHVSDRSFKDPDKYVVRSGEVVLGSVGRAEGRLGTPALITPERDGWLASNDVMRLRPLPGVNAGALWLAIAASTSQLQLRALPFGSVVDHTNPQDVESQVWLPPLDTERGAAVQLCWSDLTMAHDRITSAAATVEALLNLASL